MAIPTLTPTGPRTWIWFSALVISIVGCALGYVWYMGVVLSIPSGSDPGYPLSDEALFNWVVCTPFVGVIAALVVLGGGVVATLRGWPARWWIRVAWGVWVAGLVTAWVMGRHVVG